jgi:hypothetical protein
LVVAAEFDEGDGAVNVVGPGGDGFSGCHDSLFDVVSRDGLGELVCIPHRVKRVVLLIP